MVRYSQEGREGVQNVKNVILKKGMQRVGNMGVNFIFIG